MSDGIPGDEFEENSDSNSELNELLPCPFCGGKALKTTRREGEHRVECENRWDGCPMNMRTHHQRTAEEAVLKWNARAI